MQRTPRLSFLIILLLIATASCSPNTASPEYFVGSADQPTPETILVQAPPDSTLTPTAFQPEPPTPTPNPTFTPTPSPTPSIPLVRNPEPPINWADYPAPVIAAPLAIPPPMNAFRQPDDQVNILLMGSDQRPYDGSFRTDVLILITINFDQRSINLTSFPRDLYVYIPGWTMERINTAQLRGGFELTALTMEYNFGVRPDHWAIINFDGFVTLIDLIGGIDVEVAETLIDHRDQYGRYIVRKGVNHMDGETALWYVRSRYTTNDFDRTRRQQEVIQAIANKLLRLDMVTKAPQLYDHLQQSFQTDLGLDDLLSLIPFAADFHPDNFGRYAIGQDQVTPWRNPYNGAQVLIPDQQLVRQIIRQALNIE